MHSFVVLTLLHGVIFGIINKPLKSFQILGIKHVADISSIVNTYEICMRNIYCMFDKITGKTDPMIHVSHVSNNHLKLQIKPHAIWCWQTKL